MMKIPDAPKSLLGEGEIRFGLAVFPWGREGVIFVFPSVPSIQMAPAILPQ